MPKGIYERKLFSEGHKRKISEANKGHIISLETRKKIGEANKGKVRSEEAKKKLSKAHLGNVGHWLGEHFSEEHKQNISKSKIGIKNHNYGKCFSKEIKEKMRLAHLGKCMSEESKKKNRLARLKIIEKTIFEGGQISPAYNLNACKFFEKFDQSNCTIGMYATNGGEYHIKELGYFPDYFNPNLKLIMEWDEEHHYGNNQLKKRDIRRQKEIENLFPDYKFVRIREKDLIGVSK